MNGCHASRREFIKGSGALVVGFSIGGLSAASAQTDGLIRGIDPANLDSWIAIARDGSVTVYSGRVDLGTGTEIVLAQFAAEELDVPVERVRVIMGDTRVTPDQGKTTASLNVIRGSQPIRIAAAEARAALLRLASEALGRACCARSRSSAHSHATTRNSPIHLFAYASESTPARRSRTPTSSSARP